MSKNFGQLKKGSRVTVLTEYPAREFPAKVRQITHYEVSGEQWVNIFLENGCEPFRVHASDHIAWFYNFTIFSDRLSHNNPVP